MNPTTAIAATASTVMIVIVMIIEHIFILIDILPKDVPWKCHNLRGVFDSGRGVIRQH